MHTTEADATGLTEAEAARRLTQYGENALVEHHVSVFERLAHFFWGPIPWMIEIAAVLSAVLEHWADLAIILAMLFINAGVGFWQEFKADNAIALLKQRLALKARVKRDGAWKDIEAKLLVPGDVVLVKLGNVVPADLKLIEGAYLSVDQSALTGESLPVDKKVGDEAYSGSIAKQGEMTGVVTATGMKTYFGKTAHLVQQAKNGLPFPARGAAHRQFPHPGDDRPGARHRARGSVPPRPARSKPCSSRSSSPSPRFRWRCRPCLSVTMAVGAERLARIQGDRLASRRRSRRWPA